MAQSWKTNSRIFGRKSGGSRTRRGLFRRRGSAGLSHYIVVYDVDDSTLESTAAYGCDDLDTAEARFRELELEMLKTGRNVRVLLFSADSMETLKVTHPHYFSERRAHDQSQSTAERALLFVDEDWLPEEKDARR